MTNEPLDFEAEYDNRARVPEHPEIIDGWGRDAGAYRAARTGAMELGLAYGAHPRQRIDLFHPDTADAGRPLVVFVHGGYWRSLEPALFSHFAAGANAHGLSVAVPGYRLCPEVTVADIVEDLRAAFAFLLRRFQREIVVCGHSAGAHLAACMIATDWRAVAPDLPDGFLRRGLGISGVFELAPLLATSINLSLRLDVGAAHAVSPAFWAPPSGATFEAWVGERESAEFLRQSRDFAARWAEAGASTRFEILPGANHFTAPNPLSDPASSLTKALVSLCATAAG